jgi:poly [ADP-ribose] polymerase
MLDSLLDIEIAFKILNLGSAEDEEADPVDTHYKKLRCGMEVLDEQSDEYKLLLRYIANTHASSHDNYKIVVKSIVKLERDGEAAKYETKKSLMNRKLLWHG